jgi:Spy/CpxP family protein refolding chaperone
MVKPVAKWKGYAVLALVFVLGAAAGGGAVYSLTQRRHAAMLHDDHELQGRRLNALARRLDLDADQKTKIGDLLDKDREDSKTLLRDHRAEVDGQIRALLRPDQQTKFDALVEERKHGRGPGRGPR